MPSERLVDPAVSAHEHYASQNFRLFLVSNLSVQNFRIFLLMYPGSVYAPARGVQEAGVRAPAGPLVHRGRRQWQRQRKVGTCNRISHSFENCTVKRFYSDFRMLLSRSVGSAMFFFSTARKTKNIVY